MSNQTRLRVNLSEHQESGDNIIHPADPSTSDASTNHSATDVTVDHSTSTNTSSNSTFTTSTADIPDTGFINFESSFASPVKIFGLSLILFAIIFLLFSLLSANKRKKIKKFNSKRKTFRPLKTLLFTLALIFVGALIFSLKNISFAQEADISLPISVPREVTLEAKILGSNDIAYVKIPIEILDSYEYGSNIYLSASDTSLKSPDGSSAINTLATPNVLENNTFGYTTVEPRDNPSSQIFYPVHKTENRDLVFELNRPVEAGETLDLYFAVRSKDLVAGTYELDLTFTAETNDVYNNFILNYDLNDGKVSSFEEENKLAPKTITIGSREDPKVFIITDVAPEKEHFSFIGWNTKADGTGTPYAPKDSIETRKQLFDEFSASELKLTLYAQYRQLNTFTLSFNIEGSGDQSEFEEQSVEKSENTHTFTIPNITPSRNGYTFAGFSTKQGGEPVYQPGEDVELSLDSNNITLYAIFNINTYQITFKNYDGTILEEKTLDYDSNPAYTGATPERPSTDEFFYTFTDWSPEITSVTADQTYIATFSSNIRSYTITWQNDDGATLETDADALYGTTPEYNGKTPEKPSTEENDYFFTDWSPEIAPVASDQTYTANYVAHARSVRTLFAVGEDGTTEESAYLVYNAVDYQIGNSFTSSQGDTIEVARICEGVCIKNNSTIKTATLDASFVDFKPTSTANWFYKASSLRSIYGLENLNTTETTNMTAMFSGATSLTSLTLPENFGKNVTNMADMFYNAASLRHIYVQGDLDLSHSEPTITSSSNMFYKAARLPNYADSNVRVAYAHAGIDTNGVQGYFEHVTAPGSVKTLFDDTGENAYLVYDNAKYTTEGSYTTSNNDTITISKLCNYECINSNSAVRTVTIEPSFNDYKPISTASWFYKTSSLQSVDGLENLDTSETINMGSMFKESALTSLTLPENFGKNATDMSAMFNKTTALTSLTIPNDAGHPENNFGSSATKMADMFNRASSLISLDLPDGFGRKATSMAYMFNYASRLVTLTIPNDAGHPENNFGSSATSMAYMFNYATSLVSITALPEGFGRKATSMDFMFYNASSLRHIYVQGDLDLNHSEPPVTNSSYMFSYASSLPSHSFNDVRSAHVGEKDGIRGCFEDVCASNGTCNTD